MARSPVVPWAAPVGALSAEAVRKGDVQEPMRERPGSAVGFAGGFDFRTKRGSGGPHRLDERLHPEDAAKEMIASRSSLYGLSHHADCRRARHALQDGHQREMPISPARNPLPTPGFVTVGAGSPSRLA